MGKTLEELTIDELYNVMSDYDQLRFYDAKVFNIDDYIDALNLLYNIGEDYVSGDITADDFGSRLDEAIGNSNSDVDEILNLSWNGKSFWEDWIYEGLDLEDLNTHWDNVEQVEDQKEVGSEWVLYICADGWSEEGYYKTLQDAQESGVNFLWDMVANANLKDEIGVKLGIDDIDDGDVEALVENLLDEGEYFYMYNGKEGMVLNFEDLVQFSVDISENNKDVVVYGTTETVFVAFENFNKELVSLVESGDVRSYTIEDAEGDTVFSGTTIIVDDKEGWLPVDD